MSDLLSKEPKNNFNLNIYKHWIKAFIPNVNYDDLHFLSNKSSQIYKKLENADNFRVMRIGSDNIHYLGAKSSGCCGFYDEEHINPKNGHRFMIGFNYGH